MCSAAQAQKFLSASFFRPWVSPKSSSSSSSSSRLRRGAHPCTSQFAVRSSDRPRVPVQAAVRRSVVGSSVRTCARDFFFFGPRHGECQNGCRQLDSVVYFAIILYIKATCVSVRPSVCHDKQRRAGAGQGRAGQGRAGPGQGGPGRPVKSF